MHDFNLNKVRLLILIDWVLVLIAIGFLSVRYFENSIRISIPVIGLVLVFIIEYSEKIKFKTSVFARRILAVPFLMFGFNWINIFTLTTYRSHHRPIMIPLAIVFLIIGLVLSHYKIYSETGGIKP